jgi:hypothetical protein
MFDVYLNSKRDLLVLPSGVPVPVTELTGRWRKKRRRSATSVSVEIRSAVQRRGYYVRKLSEVKRN